MRRPVAKRNRPRRHLRSLGRSIPRPDRAVVGSRYPTCSDEHVSSSVRYSVGEKTTELVRNALRLIPVNEVSCAFDALDGQLVYVVAERVEQADV